MCNSGDLPNPPSRKKQEEMPVCEGRESCSVGIRSAFKETSEKREYLRSWAVLFGIGADPKQAMCTSCQERMEHRARTVT